MGVTIWMSESSSVGGSSLAERFWGREEDVEVALEEGVGGAGEDEMDAREDLEEAFDSCPL